MSLSPSICSTADVTLTSSSGALTNPSITPVGMFLVGDTKTLHAATWTGSPTITRTWEKQTGSDPWQSIGSYADNDTIGTTQGNVSLSDIGYRFRLKDVNGDTSQIAYSRPTAVLNMVAPAGLVGAPSDSEVDLAWDAVDGAESYNIYRDGVLLANSATNSYADTTAINSTNYSYAIAAVHGTTESARSASVTAVPMWIVSGLDLDANTDTSLTVTWSCNVPGPSNFDWEIQETGGDWSSLINNGIVDGGDRSLGITGLTPSTAYDIRVRAHDGSNFGNWDELDNKSTSAGLDFLAKYLFAGGSIADTSGNGFDLTNNGDVVQNDGRVDFNASNFLSNASLEWTAAEMTMCGWFNTTVGDAVQFLMARSDASANAGAILSWVDGSIHFYVGSDEVDIAASYPTDGTWFFVALRVKASGEMQAWFNGTASGLGSTTLPTTTGYPLVIGADANASAGLLGSAGKVQIFASAITDAQIAAIYAAGPPA